MLTLAIDTATDAQTIALVDGDSVVARRLHVGPPKHAETLLRNIDDILAQQEVSLSELELISCGIGPGSFTGVRVGLATSKALAFANAIPLVGVSTLAAVARPVASVFEGVVIAAVDARRGEIYAAAFCETEGTFDRLCDDAAFSYDDFVRFVSDHRAVAVVGNALQRIPNIKARLGDIRSLPQPWNGPSGPSLAFLGQATFSAQGAADLTELEPNYIRLSDAEIALAGRVP